MKRFIGSKVRRFGGSTHFLLSKTCGAFDLCAAPPLRTTHYALSYITHFPTWPLATGYWPLVSHPMTQVEVFSDGFSNADFRDIHAHQGQGRATEHAGIPGVLDFREI